MQQVLQASDPALPVHIHIAEQQKEVNDCLSWSGQRPIAWLYDHWISMPAGVLSTRHMRMRKKLARMAQSGAVAGLCPTTEANLGDGIFPGVDYLAQRGHWGIGSDSHVSLNVVEELRWFEYGQRLRDQRRNRLTTATQNVVGDVLYTRALAGGARPVAPVGRLSVGYRADWLVLDGQDPYGGSPPPEILNRWLFAGHAGQIRDVYVGGTPALSMGNMRSNRPLPLIFCRYCANWRRRQHDGLAAFFPDQAAGQSLA
ncbi:amidohydrolase family protein [Klebsiella quasipneumoniae]|uniref:amidohydrolase family protein n=1 Tax=Klebsiella quasipneumoniae TaxID=1463165 RepID=UPI00388EA0FB